MDPTASVLSPKEVAVLLGASEDSVYRMFHAGQLPGYRVGRLIRFRRAAIDAYMGVGAA